MKEKGNYIMYARATSGDKLNNNKFSVCSVNNITNVLQKKRNNCFVGTSAVVASKSRPAAVTHRHFIFSPPESGQPICGNGLVEPGEECDCGYSDQCRDQCCYDANQPDNKKCKLKPNKVCRWMLAGPLKNASGIGREFFNLSPLCPSVQPQSGPLLHRGLLLQGPQREVQRGV